MNLPKDILDKINSDFPDTEERELIIEILSSLEVNESERVIRCILFTAAGNLDRLGNLEALAKTDYRDVIMAGEYEYPSVKRINDFNKPFCT